MLKLSLPFILKDTTGPKHDVTRKIALWCYNNYFICRITGEKRRTKVCFTMKVEEMAFRYICSFVNLCEKVKIFKICSPHYLLIKHNNLLG